MELKQIKHSRTGGTVTAPLPGVHRVRSRLASGEAEYWYAWRGGPKILSVNAPNDRVLAEQVRKATPAAAAAFYAEKAKRRAPAEGSISGLISTWMADPLFAKLGERTQRDTRKHLAVVVEGLGNMPLQALEAKAARRGLLEWRNQYAATPRTADHYMTALASALAWGRDNGHLTADPLKAWPRLYSVDRSSIVWEAVELAALVDAAEPELQRAILVAVYSGLRLSDLIGLTWADVGGQVITRETKKRKRVVHIPITPELLVALDACPKVAETVLTKDGAQWKISTLEKRFRLARTAAQKALTESGVTTSIMAKRWHDLRGSYATMLVRADVEIGQVARIMGWSKEKADEIATRYVGGEAVALAVLERLKRLTPETVTD